MTDSAPQRAGSTAGERAGVLVPVVLAMKTEEPTLLEEGTERTKRTERTEEEEGTRGGRRVGETDGREGTLVAIFESEEGALLAFAVGLVRRRPVAEELVQDAFLRLHEVWGQVENPRGWLYRSVRNMALNYLRDHRLETPLEEAPDPAGAEQPDEELGRMEAVGMVRLLLAGMAAEDRELIRLKYHEDLKYGEISRRTGLGVGNVGYKLHHLLKGMADALRHAGIEGSRG